MKIWPDKLQSWAKLDSQSGHLESREMKRSHVQLLWEDRRLLKYWKKDLRLKNMNWKKRISVTLVTLDSESMNISIWESSMTLTLVFSGWISMWFWAELVREWLLEGEHRVEWGITRKLLEKKLRSGLFKSTKDFFCDCYRIWYECSLYYVMIKSGCG